MYKTITVKKSVSLAGATLILIASGLLLSIPETGADGVHIGLSLCYNVVIPSLFPFLFLTDFASSLLTCGGAKGAAALSLFFGLVGGYPTGARALSRCVERGIMSQDKGSRLLACSVNAGPAFLITGVGCGMFGSQLSGVLLFASLTGASVAIGSAILIFSHNHGSSPHSATRKATEISHCPNSGLGTAATGAFGESLSFAVRATVSLCGYVTLFSCAGAYLSAALSIMQSGDWVRLAAMSALEVTTGCSMAAELGGVHGILCACGVLSMCGICVLLQVKSICRECGMSMKYFLLLRPAHFVLSLSLLKLLLTFFDVALPASFVVGGTLTRAFSFSPPASAALLALSFVFLLCDKRFFGFTNRRY
ncbi:MAG: hypothetical protein RR998_02985 [Oscillospiraceae bacterium]